MSFTYEYNTENTTSDEYNPVNELDAWFSVSGDMDDFIFYDEPDRIISEK